MDAAGDDAAARPVRIDDWDRPQLPAWMRVANALGEAPARRFVRLEPDDLMQAASRATGLDDFGDPSFEEPFRVLARALEREAGLSAFGRVAARRHLLQLLESRLRLEDLLRRHPEIERERIERPIVIAGLPRTGTTHLFNLLACDETLRTLPYWESLEPVPRPEEVGRTPDPRLARCERQLAFMDRVMPLFRAMHEFTVEGPHEEIQLLALHFSTQLFEASYRVPSYAEWYRSTDQTPAYRALRRALQALQWLRRRPRWALKTPQHLENLGPLVATFPDAVFVQTHRDPVHIVASLATMIAYGRRLQTRRPDPVETGRHWAARIEDMLRASVRDRSLLPASRVQDVHFHEVTRDAFGCVERIFARAEHPFGDAARAAVRAHLRANPAGRHGRVDYRLGDLGLDAAGLRRRFRFYQERFDVPSES